MGGTEPMPMIYEGDGTHAHDLCLVIILDLEPSPLGGTEPMPMIFV